MTTGSILASLRQPLRRGEVENLRGVVVEEALDLTGAALPNLDFSGATFNAPVVMRGAVFQGLAWFTAATFNAPVDFSSAVFLSDARFEQAKFHRGATFSAAEFRGVACFDQAEFGDAAFLDRMTCYGNLSLDRTRFNGAASLQDSECFGGLWGNRTVFSGRADVRGLEVHGRTWLVGAAVAEDATSGGIEPALRVDQKLRLPLALTRAPPRAIRSGQRPSSDAPTRNALARSLWRQSTST